MPKFLAALLIRPKHPSIYNIVFQERVLKPEIFEGQTGRIVIKIRLPAGKTEIPA